MGHANDNPKPTDAVDSKATTAQPPFKDGHENASATPNPSVVGFDKTDGFGNAEWDVRPRKEEVLTVPTERKFPPAF